MTTTGRSFFLPLMVFHRVWGHPGIRTHAIFSAVVMAIFGSGTCDAVDACDACDACDPHGEEVLLVTFDVPDEAVEARDGAIRIAMEEPISIHLDEVGFEEALDAVFEGSDANVMVNWSVLEAAGFEQSAPVTVRLNALPREQVLGLILEVVSGLNDFDPLSFEAHEGVLHISTARDFKRYTVMRRYNVGPMIRFWSFRDGEPYSGVALHRQDVYKPFEHVNPLTGFITYDSGYEEESDDGDLVQKLMELITDTVGRQEDWDVYGGDFASIGRMGEHLIVKAPLSMHRELEELFGIIHKTQIDEAAALLREAEISELLEQADDLRMEQNYTDALELVELAERVDPDSMMVIAMKRVLTETMSRQ